MRKLIGTLIILAALLYVVFQFFGTSLVGKVLEGALGVKVNISRIHLKIYPTELGIYGLKIHNPEGFREPVLASIPELFIRVEVMDLVRRKAHVNRVILNIDQVSFERGPGGKVNLLELVNRGKKKEAERKEKQTPPPAPSGNKPQPQGEVVKTQIDEAIVSLGTVTLTESSSGGEPISKKMNLEIREFTLRNVDGVLSLTEKIVFEVLRKAGLSALGSQFNLAASDLSEQAGQLLNKAQKSLSNIFK